MNVRIVSRGELSEKQQIMKKAYERAEYNGTQSGNHAHQDREHPQSGRVNRPDRTALSDL